MQNKNEKVVSCPPCGENVGLPTKRGFLNKKTSFATPLPAYGVLPPQVGQITSHGFTLIELLVVVLIIGILAAVALPQYQRAVEKARMVEAVINVRAIARAHQLYYLAHGEYLPSSGMERLDITIPGGNIYSNRIITKDFYYSPNGDTGTSSFGRLLALAYRVKRENNNLVELYQIYISQDNAHKIICIPLVEATDIQKKLCQELNEKGTL